MRDQYRQYMSSMLLLIVLPSATPARGQFSSGTILGTVTESSGAVIPGVVIKIINRATNLIRETVTNEGGNFRLDQRYSF
jgi:hypothetical protein